MILVVSSNPDQSHDSVYNRRYEIAILIYTGATGNSAGLAALQPIFFFPEIKVRKSKGHQFYLPYLFLKKTGQVDRKEIHQ